MSHIIVKGHKIIENIYHSKVIIIFQVFLLNPNRQQNINIKVLIF